MVAAVKKVETETLYCRDVKAVNKRFAFKQTNDLGFKAVGKYVDALIEQERKRKTKRK